MSNPADPWSIDYFNPTMPALPTAKPKAPKLLPDSDRLFALQRNLLKVMRDLSAIEMQEKNLGKNSDWHRAQKDVENAYRNIRGYLAEYANPEGS